MLTQPNSVQVRMYVSLEYFKQRIDNSFQKALSLPILSFQRQIYQSECVVEREIWGLREWECFLERDLTEHEYMTEDLPPA